MPKRGAANLPSDHGLARRGAHQSRDAISGNQVGRKAREVPLNSNARRALRLYLADRPQPRPEDYMFLSDRGGKPLALRTVQAIIHELGQRARIRRLPVTPHLMRHTFALRYLKHNPGKLLELATLLGHESLDTTALYARPTAEQLATSVERSQR